MTTTSKAPAPHDSFPGSDKTRSHAETTPEQVRGSPFRSPGRPRPWMPPQSPLKSLPTPENLDIIIRFNSKKITQTGLAMEPRGRSCIQIN